MSLLGYAQNHGIAATLYSRTVEAYDPEAGTSSGASSGEAVQLVPSAEDLSEGGQQVDANHRRFLLAAANLAGDTFLHLPGSLNNYASTPHAAALVPASGFRIEARISPESFAPSTPKTVLYKGASQYGMQRSSNRITLSWTHATGGVTFTSGAISGCTVPDVLWFMGELEDDVVSFGVSRDGMTFDALGSEQDASAYPISQSGSETLYVGVQNNVFYPYSGRIYEVRLYVDGSLVFDPIFSAQAVGASSFTESSDEGATVTINKSGAGGAQIMRAAPSTEHYLTIGSQIWEISRVRPIEKHGVHHVFDIETTRVK